LVQAELKANIKGLREGKGALPRKPILNPRKKKNQLGRDRRIVKSLSPRGTATAVGVDEEEKLSQGSEKRFGPSWSTQKKEQKEGKRKKKSREATWLVAKRGGGPNRKKQGVEKMGGQLKKERIDPSLESVTLKQSGGSGEAERSSQGEHLTVHGKKYARRGETTGQY